MTIQLLLSITSAVTSGAAVYLMDRWSVTSVILGFTAGLIVGLGSRYEVSVVPERDGSSR
jgi:zinc transporter ZupT